MFNILDDQIINSAPFGALSLPKVLTALTKDEIDSFPALRPHQAPAWHMFLVQLAALALTKNRERELPNSDSEWAEVLRGLTPGFREDEPWHLVWDNHSVPAFFQPILPDGIQLTNLVTSPDALDLLITAKNHDLKKGVGRRGGLDDWVFALVSLQTGEGYGGSGNYGIARMNGGSSSRAMVSLAPLPEESRRSMMPRLGERFQRDVALLLESRDAQLEAFSHLGYPNSGGLALTWLAPWPERSQLQLSDLDIWFVEVCRRIRLQFGGGTVSAMKGKSTLARINAKQLRGALGDPFAPVHKTEGKSLTLGDRDFDYRLLTELLLSGEWNLPVLAESRKKEKDIGTMVLMAEALARGNCRTDGFKSRILPLGGDILRALGPRRKRLHELALQQIEEVDSFGKALARGLAFVAARGEVAKIKKEHYAYASEARNRFNHAVDQLFFRHLWNRFSEQEYGSKNQVSARRSFSKEIYDAASKSFEAALPAIPCAGIFRPRAETRARNFFDRWVRREFPELFNANRSEETTYDANRNSQSPLQ